MDVNFKIVPVFLLILFFALISTDHAEELSPFEQQKKQWETYNRSKGIIFKGEWGVAPDETSWIEDIMNFVSRISKNRKEQLQIIDAEIEHAEKNNDILEMRIHRPIKKALEASPQYAGQYNQSNHEKAPYDINRFQYYYGSQKLMTKAEQRNYSFYTVKIKSTSKRKQRTLSGYKTTYGWMCYVFLFYDEKDNYVFAVSAGNE